jgi:5-methylcytosine-specific restriction enzyme subunit McrC
VGGQSLIEDHLKRRMFSLRPDLILSRDHTRVIADTKWKLIDQANRAEKYGISQPDIYQLFGYSQKYLRNQQRREVMLIYPSCESFTQPLAPFWFQSASEVLYVVPYDLDRESLILPGASLLADEGRLSAIST